MLGVVLPSFYLVLTFIPCVLTAVTCMWFSKWTKLALLSNCGVLQRFLYSYSGKCRWTGQRCWNTFLGVSSIPFSFKNNVAVNKMYFSRCSSASKGASWGNLGIGSGCVPDLWGGGLGAGPGPSGEIISLSWVRNDSVPRLKSWRRWQWRGRFWGPQLRLWFFYMDKQQQIRPEVIPDTLQRSFDSEHAGNRLTLSCRKTTICLTLRRRNF